MKQILVFGILSSILLFSCNQGGNSNSKIDTDIKDKTAIPLVLSTSLENRRPEFETNVNNAISNIVSFAKKYEWDELTKEAFMDSVVIFDNKRDFDKNILTLVKADTTIELPETFCAALENRTLIVVSPEIYSSVYPEGIEENSYEKLLTHEIAHRLHIRILNGDEDAMGPIWFYEGFAIFAADQFSNSDVHFNKEDMIEIMNNPERGSYLNYGYVFRHFTKKIPLKELIAQAKSENFNEWVLIAFDKE